MLQLSKTATKLFTCICFIVIGAGEASAKENWIDTADRLIIELSPLALSVGAQEWNSTKKEIAKLEAGAQLRSYQELAFRALVNMRGKDYQKLVDEYSELLSTSGTSTDKEFQLILNAFAMTIEYSQFEEAIKTLQALIDDKQLSPDILAIAYVAMGYLADDNRSLPDALKLMRRARSAFQISSKSRFLKKSLLTMEAYILMGAWDFVGALSSYEKLLDSGVTPSDSRIILTNLVWMLRSVREYGRALDLNNFLLKSIPEDVNKSQKVSLLLNCADLYIKLKQYSQSLVCLYEAEGHIERVPERWDIWYVYMVDSLTKNGQLETAQSYYKALRNDPRYNDEKYADTLVALAGADLSFAQGKSSLAFNKLRELHVAKKDTFREDLTKITFEFRDVISSEAIAYEENMALQQRVLNRQFFLNVLSAILIIFLITLVTVLLKNRRKERKRADMDALTGMFNRRGFFKAFSFALDNAMKEKSKLAIGLVDIDRFKSINDSFGDNVGDQMLISVGTKLREALGQDAIIGRLAGDEFGIILTNYPSDKILTQTGLRLCDTIAQERELQGAFVKSSVSIGFASYPEVASNTQTLYDSASYALYACKRMSQGRCQLFDRNKKSELDYHRKIENALTEAPAEEFSLVYQPVVDTETRATKGFEALMRWQSPLLGSVPPNEFIPIAERTGHIRRLTSIVLTRALSEAQLWPKSLNLSINLSSHDLSSIERAVAIKDIIVSSAFPCDRLIIEMTETAIIHDTKTTQESLKVLTDIGARIALDDFGTGYSSLTHLLDFKVHRLKIEKVLTEAMELEVEKHSIVETIVNMCDSLNIDCVVEGVETREQHELLKVMKAPLLQGYYFAKPMPLEQCLEYLQDELS